MELSGIRAEYFAKQVRISLHGSEHFVVLEQRIVSQSGLNQMARIISGQSARSDETERGAAHSSCMSRKLVKRSPGSTAV
jgi:hypothetical protein